MPRFKRWTVILDWRDHDVTDSDEMQIWESCEAEAKAVATRRWRFAVAPSHPSCRLVRVWVVTDESAFA